MRVFFATVVLAILVVVESPGQTYNYDQIIDRGDSLVKANVPSHLLKYFNRDSVAIKYEFRRAHWRKYLNRNDEVKNGEKTKGHFQRALIFYFFNFKEPIINADLHKGYLTFSIDISFDAHLRPHFQNDFSFDSLKQDTQVDLSFIPKYLKEARPCDFIAMDRAIEIGEQANIKNGIEPLTATLDYDGGTLKRYCWWVTSPLTREKHNDHIHGTADTVTIDAVTGEVLSHELTSFGAMH